MRVLMVSMAGGWLGPPRLLAALRDSGAHTSYLAHAGTLLTYVRDIDQRMLWQRSEDGHAGDLVHAVRATQADRLLGADEQAVSWLHKIYQRDDIPVAVRKLITQSMGDQDHYATVMDKLAITRLANALDIATPLTEELVADADAGLFVHRHGLPLVIKSRHGFAGIGVYPCGSLSDLRYAQRHCPREGGRLIQRYVEGETWMSVFVAERGTVLAQLSFNKERQFPTIVGPSSTVRCEHDDGLQATTARMAAALGYSGFGSIDFQRSADGTFLLLEFNPRPTPVSHLGKHLGVDLAAAFVEQRALSIRTDREGYRIALFPQELCRDSSGAGLSGCWHDVPHDEPALLAALRDTLEPHALPLLQATN